MAGFNKQLGLFNQTGSRLGRAIFLDAFVRSEEILCELAARERIEEELRVVELFTKGFNYAVRGAQVEGLVPREQGGCAPQHRLVGEPSRLGNITLFQRQLGFEGLTLACGQLKLQGRNDLAGALPHAHVSERILAHIVPVGVKRRIVRVRG